MQFAHAKYLPSYSVYWFCYFWKYFDLLSFYWLLTSNQIKNSKLTVPQLYFLVSESPVTVCFIKQITLNTLFIVSLIWRLLSTITERSAFLSVSVSARSARPHSDSCWFYDCVTGRQAQCWCCSGDSWCGVDIRGAVSEKRDDCSPKPVLRIPSGNCLNVNHEVWTNQGAWCLRSWQEAETHLTRCSTVTVRDGCCHGRWHRLISLLE